MSPAPNGQNHLPLLAAGRLDYGGYSYSPKVVFEDDKVQVLHELNGGNLVHDLIKEGKAQYACEIISPSTAYRKLFPLPANGGEKQELSLAGGELMRERMWVRPLVISNQESQHVGERKHGLHNLLLGKKFTFQKGTIIADGGYHVINQATGYLFYLRKDERLTEFGTYSLEHKKEEGWGFYFRLCMNPEWYDSFRQAPEAVRRMFLVANFTAALEYIERYKKNECGDDAQALFASYPNLRDLFNELSRKCCNGGDVFDSIRDNRAADIASKFMPLHKLTENED